MTKKSQLTIEDLKPSDYNPRAIGEKALNRLKASLSAFGDISGIVWNKTTGNLVSGHQRLNALKSEYGDALKIKDGCIVTPDGIVFPIRVVEWDAATEKAANVTANNHNIQGYFTDSLQSVLDDIKVDLGDSFDALMLGDLSIPNVENKDIDVSEPEDRDNTREYENITIRVHDVESYFTLLSILDSNGVTVDKSSVNAMDIIAVIQKA